jgi:DNA polymerase epsilon subunit 1
MARGRGSFGFASRGGRGRGSFRGGFSSNTHFRGGRGRGGGRGGARAGASGEGAPVREDDGTQMAERFERVETQDKVDEQMGFGRVQDGPMREGWLISMHPVSPNFVLPTRSFC